MAIMLLLGREVCNVFVAGVLLLLLSCSLFSHGYGVESEINCLKSIRADLEDPLGFLDSSWDFSNATKGLMTSVCNFRGVACWEVSRISKVNLADMGLKGRYPRGVVNCTSLFSLDLSNNSLSGSIPQDIGHLFPYAQYLNLSSNNFSGEIPSSISDCTYLNVLELDNNKFTGQIPQGLAQMRRLHKFSVANNQLSGPVPNFIYVSFGVKSYANNTGLCGAPLKNCPSLSQSWSKDLARAIKTHAALMFGSLGFGVGFVFSFFFFVSR